MAITEQVPRNVSIAAPGAQDFPYDFKVLSKAELLVTVNGVAKTVDVDYTVTGVAEDAGGNVHFILPLVGGETVLRKRDMVFARADDFQHLGDLQSATLNNDQDAPVMMAQQLKDEISLTFRLPPQVVGVDFELPVPTALAPLVWNASGTKLENGNLTLTGDLLLRGNLAEKTVGKGAALLAMRDNLNGGHSDMKLEEWLQADGTVNVLRFIPVTLHAAIKAGTEATDLSSYINNALNLSQTKRLYFPRGVYYAKNITLFAGQSLVGDGYDSVIRAPASIGNTEAILVNFDRGGSGVSNISVERLRFDGNNAGASTVTLRPRTSELISFGNVSGLRFIDNWVHNAQYAGVSVGACSDAVIEGNRFYNLGWDSTSPPGSSAEAGPALLVTTYFGTGAQSYDIHVRKNYFYSCRWSGLYFSANSGEVTGNIFKNVKEAAMFCSRLPASSIYGDRTIIAHNWIQGVTKAHISGSGIDVGLHNVTISDNYIEDVAQNGIVLTDVQGAIVTDNTILDFGKVTADNGCGITVLSQTASPNQPQSIYINHNRIHDRQAVPTGWASFGVGGSGGSAVTTVQFERNKCRGWTPRNPTASGGHIYWNGKQGANSYNADNDGTGDDALQCRAALLANQSLTTSGTDQAVTWASGNIQTDPAGLWASGNPTRFTIPQGWKKAEIGVQGSFASTSSTGLRRVSVRKSAAADWAGAPYQAQLAISTINTAVNARSSVIDVAAGDYFEFFARQDSGAALDLVGSANGGLTWISIRRIA